MRNVLMLGVSAVLLSTSVLANTANGNIEGTLNVESTCQFDSIPSLSFNASITDETLYDVLTIAATCSGIAADDFVKVSMEIEDYSFGVPGWTATVRKQSDNTIVREQFGASGQESVSLPLLVILQHDGVTKKSAVATTFTFPVELSVSDTNIATP